MNNKSYLVVATINFLLAVITISIAVSAHSWWGLLGIGYAYVSAWLCYEWRKSNNKEVKKDGQ